MAQGEKEGDFDINADINGGKYPTPLADKKE